MARAPRPDPESLPLLLERQYHVVGRAQALACGLTKKALRYRLRPDGPWQKLLPGVYATVTGTVTEDQRRVAALLHAGPGSVITGPAAVRLNRLHSPGPGTVDVLVPAHVHRQSVGFVRIHRTWRSPEQVCAIGPIRFTKVPRAVADAARFLTRFDDVRAVVSEAVQRNACTTGELLAELNEEPSARSALLRRALAEVSDGVRSVAEGDFRLLIIRGRLPRPMFNAKLFTLDGTFIALVDAWWQDAGVAAEVDSRAYHLSPDAQDRDRERHTRLIKYGIFPLHFSPRRIKTEGQAVRDEIRSAIEQGRKRPRLPIVAIPSEPPVR